MGSICSFWFDPVTVRTHDTPHSNTLTVTSPMWIDCQYREVVTLWGQYVVFDLTRSRFEPTTHHTRGEHSHHYTSDAVLSVNGKRGRRITTYEKL